MTLSAPSIRVGDPLRHGPLTAFPLFGEEDSTATYRLSVDAVAEGTVVVEEVGADGLVAELEVENLDEVPVLFLEGEELVGAKQDRVVNTSILVAAGTRVRIPVTCVEQGRWAFRSQRMMHSGVHSPSMVRYALKSSVSLSLEEQRRPVSNQVEVWESVARLHAGHDVVSRTRAMSDTFERRAEEVERYRRALAYVPGAQGLAVAVQDRIVAIDRFDKADTCEKVWDRLLSGAVLDALLAPEDRSDITASAAEAIIEELWSGIWEPVETVGEGQEFRAVMGRCHASALAHEGVVLHESAVLA